MKSWMQAVRTTAIVALFAGAAEAATVRYDYDRKNDFSSYESWSFENGTEPKSDTLVEKRIREALEVGFVADGYALAEDAEEADFRVDYHLAARNDLRVRERFRSPGFGRDLSLDRVPVGTLVVDVFDAVSGELVWRGSVSDALPSDPQKAGKKTAQAISKLLSKFPPPTRR